MAAPRRLLRWSFMSFLHMIAGIDASRFHHQRTDLMIAPVWGGRQKSIWSIDPPIMTVFRELDVLFIALASAKLTWIIPRISQVVVHCWYGK